MVNLNSSNLKKKTVPELRKMARNAGIPHTGLRKAELIAVLSDLTTQKQSRVNKANIKDSPSSVDTPSVGLKCPKCDLDGYGKEVFDTFVKKVIADKAFERAEQKVFSLYKNSKLLSNSDYLFLNGIVNDFRDMFNKFINGVETKRKFTEKASQGAKPRNIVTGRDWAEAIIELQDTMNKFSYALDGNIKQRTDLNYLTQNCAKQTFKECKYPCTPKRSRIGKDTCIYKPLGSK